MKFKSLVDVTHPEFEADAKAEVLWELHIEAREHGINGMMAYIPPQSTEIRGTCPETMEAKVLEVPLPIDLNDVDFRVGEGGECYPTELYFEKDGRISLEFYFYQDC